ncbi:hypothetical protein [Neorhodopirellula pilleata]|uniref:hypothetical protein n=1 Tax=Neorhodopirellula pilleata TaxID=2714738 RepID=UPI0011B53A78|nr:hypothetical protein [Neorhodopirellula pilleata]
MSLPFHWFVNDSLGRKLRSGRIADWQQYRIVLAVNFVQIDRLMTRSGERVTWQSAYFAESARFGKPPVSQNFVFEPSFLADSPTT